MRYGWREIARWTPVSGLQSIDRTAEVRQHKGQAPVEKRLKIVNTLYWGSSRYEGHTNYNGNNNKTDNVTLFILSNHFEHKNIDEPGENLHPYAICTFCNSSSVDREWLASIIFLTVILYRRKRTFIVFICLIQPSSLHSNSEIFPIHPLVKTTDNRW